MKRRLFLLNILIICGALLIYFAASLYFIHTTNMEFASNTVIDYAKTYAALFDKEDEPLGLISTATVPDNIRITVIASDGVVLKDSQPLNESLLENHLNREEVQAALAGTPRVVVRHSATLDVDLMYYAVTVPLTSGNLTGDDYVFVRAATPVTSVNDYLRQSLPLLVVILLALVVVALGLERHFSRKLLQPLETVRNSLQSLNSGHYIKAAALSHYDETKQIIKEIDGLAVKLEQNIGELTAAKNMLDNILNNINDGLFALDRGKNIILLNRKAQHIFGAGEAVTGKNLSYLTYDQNLTANIDECVSSEQGALFEITLEGSIYLVTVKKLEDRELFLAVLSDVTENRENQKMREEFFANASHELKTPLTAIRGFSELAALNNHDAALDKFIVQIRKETERMLLLIGDMLKISELENTHEVQPVEVDLIKICEDVRDSLATVIAEKKLTVAINGAGVVTAENDHIYELVKNLVENAVKYNIDQGRVDLTITEERNTISLLVADTGIGIAPADQSRIFERFYRVDKGRSRMSGGTGLGLSIVKHICNLYGATLSLKSKPHAGTQIQVVFNK
jgi:two-component system, OmpR family, phosphate regulon sensor histidine kinase PhoR